MKAKVVIENGQTTISLTPENEFETSVIEKVYIKKDKNNLDVNVNADYDYGSYKNHSISISIKEIK